VTFTEKQYLRSVGSSHLRADAHHDDVDTLVAAGSSGETLAAVMLRVRGEYDVVRAQLGLSDAYQQQQEVRARVLEQQAVQEVKKMNRGPTRAQFYRDKARAVRQEASEQALVDHVFVMTRMKSLQPAARMLLALTTQRAREREHDFDDQQLVRLASKVLQAFIAPRCPNCGGRGFNGGHRQPAVRCGVCRETGALTLDWGGIEFELVGRQLLAVVDAKVEKLQRHLARRVRG
jgi:hypothetical protein